MTPTGVLKGRDPPYWCPSMSRSPGNVNPRNYGPTFRNRRRRTGRNAFLHGLTAIDGGKMDGFNKICYADKGSYTTYSRDQLPAYWNYADRYVLADHFFTSMYGPTFPEHLYAVAAQSYGIVGNKSVLG